MMLVSWLFDGDVMVAMIKWMYNDAYPLVSSNVACAGTSTKEMGVSSSENHRQLNSVVYLPTRHI